MVADRRYKAPFYTAMLLWTLSMFGVAFIQAQDAKRFKELEGRLCAAKPTVDNCTPSQ